MVHVGTELRITVRNELTTAIRVAGRHDHGVASTDTALVAPGGLREFGFRVTVPGTYFYRAVTDPAPATGSPDPDTQLVGAFIVDPSDAVRDDRVLVITRWRKFIPDPVAGSPAEPVVPSGQRVVAAVNGLSWPFTERFAATVGDTLRWRVINGDVNVVHPLHLHGFYFRVEGRGDLAQDTVYDAAQRRMAVTEPLPPWQTMALSWSPERAGNWLFHCHMVAHMSPRQRLDRILADSLAGGSSPTGAGPVHDDLVHEEHATHGGQAHEMAGLIVGITVTPRLAASATPHAAPSPDPARRKLRLFAQRRNRVFGDSDGYGFVLQEGARAPAADSIRIPGSELALTRGEPVEISVLNRTPLPISVHWHGIELESYYDGVAGWSGDTRKLAPAIATGDSFVVRFTPARAGTFIYHIHDEAAAS